MKTNIFLLALFFLLTSCYEKSIIVESEKDLIWLGTLDDDSGIASGNFTEIFYYNHILDTCIQVTNDKLYKEDPVLISDSLLFFKSERNELNVGSNLTGSGSIYKINIGNPLTNKFEVKQIFKEFVFSDEDYGDLFVNNSNTIGYIKWEYRSGNNLKLYSYLENKISNIVKINGKITTCFADKAGKIYVFTWDNKEETFVDYGPDTNVAVINLKEYEYICGIKDSAVCYISQNNLMGKKIVNNGFSKPVLIENKYNGWIQDCVNGYLIVRKSEKNEVIIYDYYSEREIAKIKNIKNIFDIFVVI